MVRKSLQRRKKKSKGGAVSNAYQVYRHIPIIQLLGKLNRLGDPASRRMQDKVLQLSPDTVRAMGNITLNALNDRIPMTSKQKSEFQRHQVAAKTLARPNGSIHAKKKVIQEGGFLPILAALAPAAASIIGAIINNRRSGD